MFIKNPLMGNNAKQVGRCQEIAFLKSCHKHGLNLEDDTLQILEKEKNGFIETRNQAWMKAVQAADIFVNWLLLNSPSEIVNVKMIPEKYGKDGIVSDVMISMKNTLGQINSLGVSIKHFKVTMRNHRPKSTPKHLGLKESSDKTQLFYQEYDFLNQKIYQQIKNFQKFSLIPNSINRIETIYKPFNQLVLDTINSFKKSPEMIDSLFRHLVGLDPHILFLHSQDSLIRIYFFNEIEVPTSVKAKLDKGGRDLVLSFSNGYNFRLTLHNCQSKITPQLSLKYSTILLNLEKIVRNITI